MHSIWRRYLGINCLKLLFELPMEKTTFILVDDDSTSNLIAEFNIRKVMKQATVKVFSSAEKALAFIMAEIDTLRSQDASFLLTDLNMPAMDGRELLVRLVQWDPTIGETLQIYTLSAIQEHFGNELATGAVVRGNLTKPLKIAAVESLLSLK